MACVEALDCQCSDPGNCVVWPLIWQLTQTVQQATFTVIGRVLLLEHQPHKAVTYAVGAWQHTPCSRCHSQPVCCKTGRRYILQTPDDARVSAHTCKAAAAIDHFPAVPVLLRSIITRE
jgi:hypothetical protein